MTPDDALKFVGRLSKLCQDTADILDRIKRGHTDKNTIDTAGKLLVGLTNATALCLVQDEHDLVRVAFRYAISKHRPAPVGMAKEMSAQDWEGAFLGQIRKLHTVDVTDVEEILDQSNFLDKLRDALATRHEELAGGNLVSSLKT